MPHFRLFQLLHLVDICEEGGGIQNCISCVEIMLNSTSTLRNHSLPGVTPAAKQFGNYRIYTAIASGDLKCSQITFLVCQSTLSLQADNLPQFLIQKV